MLQEELFLKERAHSNDGALSRQDAAAALNVSQASIANWVKTGYLKKHPCAGYVTRESFEAFCNSVVGTEKLNARANKQHAVSHAHETLSRWVLENAWKHGVDKNYGDYLAQTYEESLSDMYKNKEGVYYTPLEICREIVGKLGVGPETQFCDPCCGSGNFLIAALEAGADVRNITGYDLDPAALEIAKRRIFDRTGNRPETLHIADFLQLEVPPYYDVVATNPPWGKKYPQQEKHDLAVRFGFKNSADSCSFFVSAILKCLKHERKAGLLLPESFWNVRSFEEARILLLKQSIEYLIDHGRAFEGLFTKAGSVVLSKKEPSTGGSVLCTADQTTMEHPQRSFAEKPFSIINFTASRAEMEVVERMLHSPHSTLKNNVRWGLGIVTGNNRKHVSRMPQDGFIPVYRGADIQKGFLKKPGHFIREDFSEFQQVAPLDLYHAPCKIMYRFISSDIVFYCDREQRLILNSANMLAVDESKLGCSDRLADYFNLDVINWFHKKLFGTHKILRSNLECIPIYMDYLAGVATPCNQTLAEYLSIEEAHGTYRLKA